MNGCIVEDRDWVPDYLVYVSALGDRDEFLIFPVPFAHAQFLFRAVKLSVTSFLERQLIHTGSERNRTQVC